MKEYIDKAVIKAEIEGLKRNTFTNFDEGVNAAAQILLDFLDTLEVKEVDLEKENLPISNSLTKEGLFTFEDGSQAIITKTN